MGYSGKRNRQSGDDTIGSPRLKHGRAGNRRLALTVLVGAGEGPFLTVQCEAIGSPEHHFRSGVALTAGVEAFAGIYRHLLEEVTMATQRHGQIVETPTEARQAEPGPSVLALLSVSTGLAVLILGIVWFVFFRT
jgi:hypothetical protein